MNRLSLNVLLAFVVLSAGRAALAQDRAPAERQTLLDLAFTLGESHALRQVCEGGDDQYWRSRMVRLTEVEKADQAFDVQLRERFNAGFAARQDAFPGCDDASRQAEQRTARKGQALAATLSRSMVTQAPPQALQDQAAPETVADR
ncbi:TIGR02301 family protein [Caulobacter sp.]|uniref:TIGR02301 family protein n=1 Tax=Caulobacter sp. TaxID=78 RepID=UPI003BB039CC